MEKLPTAEMLKTVKGTIIPIIDKYALLKVSAPQALMPAGNTTQTNVVIVIDVSGSMAGTLITQAKEALIQFVNIISKYNVIITIIPFHSYIDKMQCTSETYMQAINFIKSLNATGGTVFANVFQELMNMTQKNPEQNYFIAFFTDGQGESYEVLSPLLNKFKDNVLNSKIMAAIHTLGFGSYHDSSLLSKIINYGTKEGTFQYISSAAHISEAIARLTPLMDFSSFWCEIIISESEVVRANFEKEEDKYVASVQMELTDPNQVFPVTYLLRIHSKETIIVPIEVVKGVAPIDIIEMADNFTEMMRRKLIAIISRMGQGKLSNAELLEQKAIVDIFRDKLSELMVSTLKSKDKKKMAAAEKLKECKEIFTEYFLAFNEAMTSGVVSNVSLARLNNIAYKGIIDSKAAREMAKRTAVGQKYMEDMEKNIKKVTKGINFEKLREEHKDKIESYGNCAITCQNWLEALEEGDCLCLTYDAERNLEDILDSTTVRIKDINVSMLTAEAFVNAAMFTSKSQHGIKLADFGVGKGSESVASKGSKSLAKVLPNEIVNGIIPIYICKEHWLVAKLKMAPLNAWTDTHDILAISKHHPIRIPFLVLIRALDTAKTEHKRMQFQWILDTCLALYNEPENKELIMEDHKETFDKYLECPQYRTTEFVRSVPIFFTHFCMAIKYKDIKIEDVDVLMKAVIEEMLRRNTKDITNDREEQMGFVTALMPLNLRKTAEELADIAIEKQRVSSKTSPAAMFSQVLKEKGMEVDEKFTLVFNEDSKKDIEILNAKEKNAITEFEVPMVIKDIDEKISSVINMYSYTLKYNPDVISILNLAKEFVNIDPNKYSTLEGLGLTTNEQIAYLILQNSLQASNAKRKTSVNAGNYLSPFAPVDNVKSALVKIRRSILKDATEYLAGRKLKGKVTKNKTPEDAKEFARSKNPYEAAGILMGLSNKAELKYFLDEMEANDIPLLKDKLRMLFTCEYKGVKLIDEVSGYYNSASSAFEKLFKKYFLEISEAEWYEIGYEFKSKLNETYDRANKNRSYGHPPFP